jgi:hypothetical protein
MTVIRGRVHACVVRLVSGLWLLAGFLALTMTLEFMARLVVA